jgi:hypothetical protein
MPHGTSTIDPSVFYDERARQQTPTERTSHRKREKEEQCLEHCERERARMSWSIKGSASKGPNRPRVRIKGSSNRPNSMAPQLNRLSPQVKLWGGWE